MKVSTATIYRDVLQIVQSLFEDATREEVRFDAQGAPKLGNTIRISSQRPNTADIRILVEGDPPAILVEVGKFTSKEIHLTGDWSRDREHVELLIEMVQAAVSGTMKETLWERRGTIVKSSSEFRSRLRGRVTITAYGDSGIWVLPFAKPSRVMTYSPWETHLNEVQLDPVQKLE